MKKGILIAIIFYLIALFTPLTWLVTIPSTNLDHATNSSGRFEREYCTEEEIADNPYLVECFHTTPLGHAVNIIVFAIIGGVVGWVITKRKSS